MIFLVVIIVIITTGGKISTLINAQIVDNGHYVKEKIQQNSQKFND